MRHRLDHRGNSWLALGICVPVCVNAALRAGHAGGATTAGMGACPGLVGMLFAHPSAATASLALRHSSSLSGARHDNAEINGGRRYLGCKGAVFSVEEVRDGVVYYRVNGIGSRTSIDLDAFAPLMKHEVGSAFERAWGLMAGLENEILLMLGELRRPEAPGNCDRSDQ